MCLVSPGLITRIDGSTALVDIDGRMRSVSLALEPDATIGDWVVVAGGVVLRLVDRATAREMQAAVTAAYPPPPIAERSPGRSQT